jgi:hypothetical protein
MPESDPRLAGEADPQPAGEPEPQLAGWKALDKSWHDTTVDYCDVCGNLLIRRYWEFPDEEGKPLRSCNPECERLYGRLRRARSESVAPWSSPRNRD